MRYGMHIAVMMVLVVGCCVACSRDEPVLLGYVGPLTGQYSDLGVQGRNGVRLAVEEFNDAGGLGGRPVHVLSLDDFSTPAGTVEAFQQFAAKKALAVVGPMTSGQARAALPAMEAYGGVVVSPTVSTPGLSGRKDNFFRVVSTNENMAHALVDYVVEELHVNSVVTVGDGKNAEYVETFNNEFMQRFKEVGGRILEHRIYDLRSTSDRESILDTLKRIRPDAVLLSTSARDFADIAQNIMLSGLQIQILGPNWPATREMLLAGGLAVEGAVFAMGFSEKLNHTPYKVFQQVYLDRYGFRPNFAATFGYEAASVLLRGLAAGVTSPEEFRQFLERTGELEGVYGPLRFDEFGDVVRGTVILQVRNGEFVPKQQEME